jgi:hypothetical protein
MTTDEAIALWEKSRSVASKGVIASMPIVEWPQGPMYGNDHEAHVSTWTMEQAVACLPGINRTYLGDPIGVFAEVKVNNGQAER